MIVRLLVAAALIAGCVWLITSATVTGWLVWLVAAFALSVLIGTFATVSQ